MIIIGADHGGYETKEIIIDYLKTNDISYLDVSNLEIDSNDDYPDIALNLCKEVLKGDNLGIAICGSGIGICMACNKIKGIRAANCFNEYTTTMTRKDNNANVLCLGGRLEYSNNKPEIEKILKAFIDTEFLGDRHLRRVNKIKILEENFGRDLWD